MKSPIRRIRESLSLKLSAGILLFVLLMFLVSLGFLFHRSRQLIRKESIAHAERVLDNTVLRVSGIMDEVETATHHVEWHAYSYFRPDSLQAFIHRVVALNPNVYGCSVMTEPHLFPQYGRYFSAHSVRQGDSVITVHQGEYEYFDKVWYSMPRVRGEAIWVVPFSETSEGASSSGINASYCLPLYNSQRQLLGIISTDLSLAQLSNVISAQKPFPHSYAMMLDHKGHYYVHPDTTKLFHSTIFDGVDIDHPSALATLGLQMTEGKLGHMPVFMDGESCMVFYRPLPHTNWSIAIVCTEDDMLGDYHQMTLIIIPLLLIGMLLMLLLCRQTVNHYIEPVNELVSQSRHISGGYFDDFMPRSTRQDVVGRLQNSFVDMQQSIASHVSNLQQVNQTIEQRNSELSHAKGLVAAAEARKSAFIQDVLHQVRTPLNVIQGFVQVLRDSYGMIPADETNRILETMQHHSITITRMVTMLVSAAGKDGYSVIERNDYVSCNKTAYAAAVVYHQRPPETVELKVETTVPDSLRIHTNKRYLTQTLNELLYNAKKFTTEGHVILRVQASADIVEFVVEDTGPGIAESERSSIFTQFYKLDGFTEGLGLGLPICKQYACQLGGDLLIDDSYEHGSRFILQLPKT